MKVMEKALEEGRIKYSKRLMNQKRALRNEEEEKRGSVAE